MKQIWGEFISVLKMLRKGKPVQKVANVLDMKIEVVTELYRLLQMYADQDENHLNELAG